MIFKPALQTLERKFDFVFSILILLTALHVGVIVFFPLEPFPDWFWLYHPKKLPFFWLLFPLIGISYGLIRFLWNRPHKPKSNLLILIGLGIGIQVSFALMEGKGMDAIGKKKDAELGLPSYQYLGEIAKDIPFEKVLFHYTTLINTGELQGNLHTKPPGAFLFYIGLAEISQTLFSSSSQVEGLIHLTNYFFPFLTYLTLLPLFLISRHLAQFEGRSKHWVILPCILYLFLPNLTLIVAQLDQCFYPLLNTFAVYLFLLVLQKKQGVLAFFVGMGYYLVLFFTFSLLALLPFLLGGAIFFFYQEYQTLRRDHRLVRQYAQLFLAGCLGFGIAYFFFKNFFNYDALQHYLTAMLRHQHLKNSDWGVLNTLYYAFLNMVEFFYWLGMPFVFLFLLGIYQAALGCFKRDFQFSHCLALSLLASLLMVAFFGKTVGETARLWIFFVPFLTLSASVGLQSLKEARQWHGTLIVLLLQLITIFTMKAYQDFDVVYFRLETMEFY